MPYQGALPRMTRHRARSSVELIMHWGAAFQWFCSCDFICRRCSRMHVEQQDLEHQFRRGAISKLTFAQRSKFGGTSFFARTLAPRRLFVDHSCSLPWGANQYVVLTASSKTNIHGVQTQMRGKRSRCSRSHVRQLDLEQSFYVFYTFSDVQEFTSK